MRRQTPLSYVLLAASTVAGSGSVVLQMGGSGMVRNKIFATNPYVQYFPETSCTPSGPFGRCTPYNPWNQETYSQGDWKETFFRTSSWGNEPANPDQIRHVRFGFRGLSVAVYGAPKSRLVHPPGKQEVCMDEHCVEIPARELYDEPGLDQDEPVLLWSLDGLRNGRFYHLRLRLLDTGGSTGLSLHHIEYTSFIVPRSPYRLQPNEEFVNITYRDTHPTISYLPKRSSALKSARDFNPWELDVFVGRYLRNDTFHHASNWAHVPKGDAMRRVSFSFQGTGLYVYGAPPSQIQQPHAKWELCFDETIGDISVETCEPVDSARTYLNSEERDAAKPVLLWAGIDYDPLQVHHVQLRLLEPNSPLGVIKAMTFAKVVVTEVRASKVPPTPDKVYHDALISNTDAGVSYSPNSVCSPGGCSKRFNPWDVETFLGITGVNETFHRTSSWRNEARGPINRHLSFSFTGSRVRLYGAPRPQLIHPPGMHEVCVNDSPCQLIDVQRAYLHVDPDMELLPVALWSSDQLPFSLATNGDHEVTLKLTERDVDDPFGVVRGLTFSKAIYTWEEERRDVPPPITTATSTKPTITTLTNTRTTTVLRTTTEHESVTTTVLQTTTEHDSTTTTLTEHEPTTTTMTEHDSTTTTLTEHEPSTTTMTEHDSTTTTRTEHEPTTTTMTEHDRTTTTIVQIPTLPAHGGWPGLGSSPWAVQVISVLVVVLGYVVGSMLLRRGGRGGGEPLLSSRGPGSPPAHRSYGAQSINRRT